MSQLFSRFYGKPSLNASFVERAVMLMPVLCVVVGFGVVHYEYDRRDHLKAQIKADTVAYDRYVVRYRAALATIESDRRSGSQGKQAN